jgi:hypothetical protein
MILGAEIAMIVLGLMAIVTGKMTLSKTKVVFGTPARILGVVAMLPMPLAFITAVPVAIVMGLQGRAVMTNSAKLTFTLIELGIVVACMVIIYAVGGKYAEDPTLPGTPVDPSNPS